MIKKMTKKAQKAQNDRISRIYTRRCSGVQVNIMDLDKIDKVAKDALAADPVISDEALGDKIAAFVQTIRVN